MTNKLGVALVHELCPICTKEMDGSIFINKKLTQKSAEEVEKMNGNVTWSKTFCTPCTDMKDKGFILCLINL
jgi:hypothetical protein